MNAQQNKYNLPTKWSKEIKQQNPLNDYPRPMLERKEWANLNGKWLFKEGNVGDAIPSNRDFKEYITVPFPWESALSGINREIKSHYAWYKRSFEIPKGWNNKKIMLNFGAVDWQSVIYINNKVVGEHKGGYDSFSFDITPYLNNSSKQDIVVKVYDPGNDKAISCGKQNNSKFSEPKGYSYSPSSGIWQTVWIEPVDENRIKDIKIVPDLDHDNFYLSAELDAKKADKIEINVMDGDKIVCSILQDPSKVATLNVPNAKRWSMNNPFLYDFVVRLKDSNNKTIDEIKSYAGMRKVSLMNDNGVERLAINNEIVFQMGILDQGYWPDGIYTAPTDEALRWDIEKIKDAGFNMIRKHIKIEPQRWYYWCDKLGILVWQDMPSTFKNRDNEEKIQFEKELSNMVIQHWNHPSIVNWIVFNEHWGLYDCARITKYIKGLDSSRMVTGNSGIDARKPSIDYEVGDIKDNHSYRPPHVPLISSKRATVNGEYGAIGYLVKDHIWDNDGPWVHYQYKGKEAATQEYEKFIGLINGYITRGLSAAVYTQWTDVENEMNGLFTYDREVEKLDLKRVHDANVSTYLRKELKKEQTDAQYLQ